ncbi:nitroreductase family protein [Halobacillus sp. BBL2006]|uniref:nitroreductase family protein n=1 Tax=Halobacillus sp. BBL2006 TaxID=1543706 RepID=UPI000544479F|nr:nitroreductase family protein [Halobacillus sp. BBL2006]KHE67258.1 nitroreductase [Halobacillus sp. BBL2006]
MTTQVKDFYTAVKERRTIYTLSKESPVADERIQEVVEHAVKHTPTAFNSQGARAVVLLNDHHDKLWNMTTETLKEIVPGDKFESTQERMDGFKNAYGTVLFFEDMSIVEGLQEQMPVFADNFPLWAQQSNGMLQYVIWTSLEQEGFGASLQHYNPLIDEKVKSEWNIPDSWKLIAQMPFGKPAAPAGEKDFQPVESRVQIHK